MIVRLLNAFIWFVDQLTFRLDRFNLRTDFAEYDRTGLLDAGPISAPSREES